MGGADRGVTLHTATAVRPAPGAELGGTGQAAAAKVAVAGCMAVPEGEAAMEPRAAPARVARAVSPGQQELLRGLQAKGILDRDTVLQAMLLVDRGNYAPCTASGAEYADRPQPIGHNATISAPHMHAHALGLLANHLTPGARALDVGCGSGYLSACMAQMVGPKGKVVAIDYLAPLVQLSVSNIKKADGHLLDSGQLVVKQGDGWKGSPEEAPFDCIHVGAAAESMPEALVAQLRPGGRMVIPVGTGVQKYWQVDKTLDGQIVKRALMGVMYVPLVKQGRPA
mmetsp:Transcript_109550/g.353552  ORF Transcript_109550/g.353552 Transcript_109550/m.353552 type:complete len:283 (-) Transcript_109550:37-885(-)